VRVEAGKDCDVKTPLQNAPPLAGSLRIADLGYFDIEVLERIDAGNAYWLSPLMSKTKIYEEDETPLDVLAWLHQNGPVVDRVIRIGVQRKLKCRIIAWRLPEEVANRRRQKVLANAK